MMLSARVLRNVRSVTPASGARPSSNRAAACRSPARSASTTSGSLRCAARLAATTSAAAAGLATSPRPSPADPRA
eukprot:365237-Chlamydomonas_euryale.AAC.2